MPVLELDAWRFNGRKANIKRPVEIAYYSAIKGRCDPFSLEALRYYCPPWVRTPHTPEPAPINLSAGFDTFDAKDESKDAHLDSLLETIEAHERETGQKLNADFVSFRGMMTKFVLALLPDEDGFGMLATRYQGTVFIEEDFRDKRERQQAQFDQQRQSRKAQFSPEQMSFWGWKFENLALLDRPQPDASRDDIEKRHLLPVSNTSEFCTIVQTGLGNNSMVIGGEVDGVLGYKPDNDVEPPRWIELKTARKPTKPRDYEFFGKKLLKFWAQSYLIGCPTIVVGYRTQDGYLVELEEFKTQTIPRAVSGMCPGKYDANACLSAASQILEFLKTNIEEGGVYKISRQKGQAQLSLQRQSDSGTGEILSAQFKQWRESMT